MDTSRWESVVHMCVPNMFDTALQNIATQTLEQMDFKCYQTRPNTIKQHQIRWLNGKLFGHQTMFDGVWSPNISCLDMYSFRWPVVDSSAESTSQVAQ